MTEKDRFDREMLETPSQEALDAHRQRILDRHGCPSALDYDDEEGCIRLLCALTAGHSGPHQSSEGFPWEDNPVVYFGPLWLHMNALLRLKGSTDGAEYWVQYTRSGPSAEESFVRLIPVPEGAGLELSMAAVIESYESTGHRTSTPRLKDYSVLQASHFFDGRRPPPCLIPKDTTGTPYEPTLRIVLKRSDHPSHFKDAATDLKPCGAMLQMKKALS
jgi:hypothetical protein